MHRFKKSFKKRQSPYKPHLDRFIPRRRETNLDIGHEQLLRNYSRELPLSQAGQYDVTGHWRAECKSLKEDCQQECGLENENKILVFSPKEQKRPGTPSSNKKRPSFRRALPNSADSIFDLPDLIDDPYRHLVDWSCKDKLAVGLANEAYIKNMKTNEKHSISVSPDSVTCVRWDSAGGQLAIGTDTGTILVWNDFKFSTVQIDSVRLKCGRIIALDWNAANSVLYSLCASCLVTVENISTWSHKCHRLPAKCDPVNMKLHPDQKKLAVSTRGGQILVWCVEGGKVIRCMEAHKGPIKALAWIPWKVHLLISACSGPSGCIKLWNINSGEVIYQVQTNNPVDSVVINETYRELVTGHSDGALRFWHLPTLQVVATKPAHEGKVLQVALSPDRSTLVSLGSDECLMLWDCFMTATRYPISPRKRHLSASQGTALLSGGGTSALISTLR